MGEKVPRPGDSFVPIVTARARPYPQVTDAVRTQHGPAGPHPYQAYSRDAFLQHKRETDSSACEVR
jgi:hypothetical protein